MRKFSVANGTYLVFVLSLFKIGSHAVGSRAGDAAECCICPTLRRWSEPHHLLSAYAVDDFTQYLLSTSIYQVKVVISALSAFVSGW